MFDTVYIQGVGANSSVQLKVQLNFAENLQTT